MNPTTCKLGTGIAAMLAGAVLILPARVDAATIADPAEQPDLDTPATTSTTTPTATPTTTPTPPPPSAPTTTATPPAPTTIPAATASTTTTSAAPVAAPVTLDQMRTNAMNMLGPTADLAAEFAPFGISWPAAIFTPTGSQIADFSIRVSRFEYAPLGGSFTAHATFSFTNRATDVIALYQRALPAAGFVQVGDAIHNEDAGQFRVLTYQPPNPTYDSAELTITVLDAANGAAAARIELTDGISSVALDQFNAWSGLRLPDGAVLRSASVGTVINTYNHDVTLQLGATYDVPLVALAAQDQLITGLESSPYTVDPSSSNGVFKLSGQPFLRFDVQITPTGDGHCAMRLDASLPL
ncbi:MAG: hypothetical protein ACRDZN_16960 [Acidimicrobiales bacterium]